MTDLFKLDTEMCNAFILVHGLFTKVEDQLTRVRELNGERSWGFTDVDFATAEKTVPKWLEDKLVAVVLVPYLSDAPRTFHELWAVAAKEQHANWRWEGYDKAGPDTLRLLTGIEHEPGLRWEVIDLGSNRSNSPLDIRNAKLPHAGILAAAALHPEWVKNMDGDQVPFVWLPGYEVNGYWEDPWLYVPGLRFDLDNLQVGLDFAWQGNTDSHWAVPVSRE